MKIEFTPDEIARMVQLKEGKTDPAVLKMGFGFTDTWLDQATEIAALGFTVQCEWPLEWMTMS